MEKKFTTEERHLIFGISLLTGIRMLGISMVIPMFSIFATRISGSTEFLAGVAVGIFAVSQTVFQVPFGHLSDRWGRKKTTLAGLAIYLLGSVLSGLSTGILALILARVLAGAGAVSGVTLAWLADGVGPEKRNRALSYVGMSIGISVVLGFSVSSVIASHFGVAMLFYVCAALTALAFVYAALFLESGDPSFEIIAEDEVPIHKEDLLATLRNPDLMRIFICGFIGSAAFSAVLFMVPILIHKQVPLDQMWKIYGPTPIAGTVLMFYFAKKADAIGAVKVASIAFAFSLLGVIAPIVSQDLAVLCAGFVSFYTGNCILSVVLPAAASHHPSVQLKGTIMSTLNSFQFIGSGLGGFLGGIMLSYPPDRLFLILIVLILAGQISILGLKNHRSAD